MSLGDAVCVCLPISSSGAQTRAGPSQDDPLPNGDPEPMIAAGHAENGADPSQ